MAIMEFVQGLCALSGLTCLMIGIFSLKRYLKDFL